MNSIWPRLQNKINKAACLAILAVLLVGLSSCGKNSDGLGQTQAQASESTTQSSQNDARHIADTCVKCHPASGAIVDPSYPQINGQSANYLTSALQAYVSGARKNETMQNAVANLKQQDISDMAKYYSLLDTPWKTVLLHKTSESSTPSQKDINAGAALAVSCNSCHGKDGNSEQAGISSLAGLSVSYFSKAMNEYFTGQRDNEFMKVFKTKSPSWPPTFPNKLALNPSCP